MIMALRRRVRCLLRALRPPRYVRQISSILMSMIVLFGLTLHFVRSVPPSYSCLSFGGGILVDTATGAMIRDRRMVAVAPSPPGKTYESPSPDRRYAVSIEAGSDQTFRYVLTPLKAPDKPIILEEDVAGSTYFTWLPRSNALAYVAFLPDGSLIANVAVVSTEQEGEPRLIAKLSQPITSVERARWWSPDSNLFAMEALGEGVLHIWSLKDQTITSLPLRGTVLSMDFSPDGNYLALRESGFSRSWFTIATPKTILRSWSVVDTPGIGRVVWSPDSRYAAHSQPIQYPEWKLELFSVDGQSVRDLATFDIPDNLSDVPHTFWSPDSRRLTYVQRSARSPAIGARLADWRIYSLDTGTSSTLIESAGWHPFYAPDRQRVAVMRFAPSGRRDLILMSVDGSGGHSVITQADDMGDPYWSPDGRYLATISATGQGAARVVSLTWVLRNGSQVQSLLQGFWNVRDLVWVGNDRIAYVATTGDESGQPVERVEIADLKTGAIQALSGAMKQISTLYLDPLTNLLIAWWQAKDGTGGVDGYNIAGNAGLNIARNFRYQIASGVKYSLAGFYATTGYGDQVIIVNAPGAPKFFPSRGIRSPDSPVAALKIGPVQAESLHLASADGLQSRLLRADLYGLGDPIWSPDGARFAVTEAINLGDPIVLRLYESDGRDSYVVTQSALSIFQADWGRQTFAQLAWSSCR